MRGSVVKRINRLEDWSVELTRGGHWRVKGPGVLYFMSSTPSDARSIRNTIADLRRQGAPEEVLAILRSA